MIRPYRHSDLPELLSVWAAASALAHPFLSEAFLVAERDNIPRVYLPNAVTHVWAAGGHLVGFMSLLGNEVGALFVDPDNHRQGIGRALIRWAQASHGALEVDVFERNAVGRAFYASVGFRWVSQRKHEETGFEVLRLRLPALY